MDSLTGSTARQPYLRLCWVDPETSAKGYLVIDLYLRGLAAGGCRMRPGLTENEVLRLAQIMTLKFALFEVPMGGAKCGVDYDPGKPDAPQVLARFFEAIGPYLRENYITGEDLGTNEELIIATLAKIGISTPCLPAIVQWDLNPDIAQVIASALRLDVDGLPLESVIAGYGVAQCALEALAYRRIHPAQVRVSIQGFGSVGGAVAKFLHQAGARIIAIADIEGTVANPGGLDVSTLLTYRSPLGIIDRKRLPSGYRLLDADGWLTEKSDVLIPAAIPDAIDRKKASLVQSKIIIEGANIPLSEEAERYLHKRGVYIIPDFVANSAFAFIFGAILMGLVGAKKKAILELVSSRLRIATRRILEGIDQGMLPREKAMRLAEEFLKKEL